MQKRMTKGTPGTRWQAGALALACVLGSAEVGAADSAPSRFYVAPAKAATAAAPSLIDTRSVPALRVELPAISAADKAALRKANAESKVLRVGIGRDMPVQAASLRLDQLAWTTAADGSRVSTVELRSTAATAVRLSMVPGSLPKGVTVAVYGTLMPELVYGPYTSLDLLRMAGAAGEPAWLPVVEGDTVRLELRAARGADLTGAVLELPALSHLLVSLRRSIDKSLDEIGASGDCNMDIACIPEVLDQGKSVAKYYVTGSGGGTGMCTGTLLNSNSNAQEPPPYFITANHCLNEPSEARSMHFYWNFERTTCGGPAPTTVRETTGGARLLYTGTRNDVTMVRLNAPPPSGALLSAWTTETVTAGDMLYGLHHPSGDLKKFSRGIVQGLTNYQSDASSPTGTHIRVIWNAGTTEGGSSGSGLFNSNDELVGTLHGGYASCAATGRPDWYGRFDQAYPSLQPWLAPEGGEPPPDDGTPLTSGVPVTGSIGAGEFIVYRIQTEASDTRLLARLTGLSADADLAVFRGSIESEPVCVSDEPDTAEDSCRIDKPGAATWYVAVVGYDPADYTLTVTRTAGGGSSGRDDEGGGGAFHPAWISLLLMAFAVRRRRGQR